MIKKILLVVAVVAVAVVGKGASVSAQAAPDNVTICHATNSVNNPYVQMTVNENAVDGVGGGDHLGEHTGPLVTSEAEAQAMKDAQEDWGDIIPPVPADADGQNWTAAGQAIYANNCNFVTTPDEPVVPGRGGGDPTVNATPASTTAPVVVAALPSTSGESAVATVATVSLAAAGIAALSFAVKAAYVKFF